MKRKNVVTTLFVFSILTLFMASLLAAPLGSTVTMGTNDPNGSIAAAGMESQETNWHDGPNRSTSEVEIKYLEHYDDQATPENYVQRMSMEYTDNTRSQVWLDFAFQFAEGGVDASTQQIDWNKLYLAGPSLSSSSNINGTNVGTLRGFNGFWIFNKTAAEVEFAYQFAERWSWGPKFGQFNVWLSYINTTMKIGNVTLDTRDYTYDGRALKESIATFNVTINASISDSVNTVYIPVVLSFRVIHNITATEYKYGMNIDWSAHKDFPFGGNMKTGDNFTLFKMDGFSLGMESPPGSGNALQLANFSTTAENDTAIFLLDGVEYAREYVTKQYLINGTELHNTTRIYFYNQSDAEGIYGDEPVSAIFVLYDGFKYNQSTGFTLDPYVIVGCSERAEAGIPWTGLSLYLIGLLALISLVASLRRKRDSKIPSP